MITIMTNRSLQTYTMLCGVFVLAGLLLCLVFFWWGYMSQKRSGVLTKQKLKAEKKMEKTVGKKSLAGRLWRLCFVVSSGIALFHFIKGYVPELQDAVYEITLGNVTSGSLMTVHPFLGTTTDASMPLRMQILGLSSFYSGLITISQQSPYMIMCKVVPVAVWVLSMLLYWAFAEKLFGEDSDKRWLFMCMVAWIYLATSNSAGMIGQRVFYAGFSGETIRGALLIPYTVYVSWQKKWYLAVLAVLAEACLVWTTFGVGYCLLIAACMFLVHLWADRRGTHAA